MCKPTVSPIQSGQNALSRKTAKVLHHPFFNRPAVVNPKGARANSKGCINLGKIRTQKRQEKIMTSVVMEKPYTLIIEDGIEILRKLATGAIRNLECKFNEIKAMQATQKWGK